MLKRTLVLPDFARYFFMLAIAVILLLFAWTISPFFNILVYAALVAIIFYPIYEGLLRKIPKHHDFAAFLSTLFVIFVVLTPLALFAVFLGQETLSAYELLSSKWIGLHVNTLTWSGLDQVPVVGPWLGAFGERYGFSSFIQNTHVDLVQFVQDIAKTVATFLIDQSASILGAVGTTVLSIFIFLVAVFFFFRDGASFVQRLKFLSPLPHKYEGEIQNKLTDTVYAIVVGNFGSGFLQGIAAGIGFAIAGVNNVILWATLTAFVALIPYVGAAVVWLPIALGLLLQGQMVWAVFLMLWGVCIVSVVDNVSHPLLIGNRSKMNSFLTFLAVLGGLFVFGPKGIIFGPLILSLTVTILHIYQLEYQDVLEA